VYPPAAPEDDEDPPPPAPHNFTLILKDPFMVIILLDADAFVIYNFPFSAVHVVVPLTAEDKVKTGFTFGALT
jgi:hypothetical protein